jgi:hypothetical protein
LHIKIIIAAKNREKVHCNPFLFLFTFLSSTPNRHAKNIISAKAKIKPKNICMPQKKRQFLP